MNSGRNALKAAGECAILPVFVLIVVAVWLPWLRLRQFVMISRKPAIIWGPTPIINMATNAAADRLRGYRSDTLVYRPYFITSEFTYNLEKWWRHAPLALVIPWAVFLWATLRYDIFQFYFDGGFLNRTLGKRLEFPLLKLLGKKLVVSAYGADVRTKSRTEALGQYHCCQDCPKPGIACICDDEKASQNLKHVRRYADATLSMGDMIEYTPGSRNDIFYWAIDLARWPFVGVSPDSRPVRVVHAPNHPEFKGSRYLYQAISELQAAGYPVELTLVAGVPNEKAREIYASADIVADQFLIGWHGNFAVEAMALGKPVIAFIRRPEYLPKGIDCPIVSATPDNLKTTLIRLIEDPKLRVELGIKGRKYVEQVFSLERVGERMERIYQELACASS